MDKKEESFKIRRGVRVAQGDPLTPNLFKEELEWIFRKLDWEDYGIKLEDSHLNNFRFVDDIVLIGDSGNDEEFIRASGEAGLENLYKAE